MGKIPIFETHVVPTFTLRKTWAQAGLARFDKLTFTESKNENYDSG